MHGSAKKTWTRLVLYGPPLGTICAFAGYLAYALAMPGPYHEGPLPPLTRTQHVRAVELRRIVTQLAEEIGERHVGVPEKLEAAARFVEAEMAVAGGTPRSHSFAVDGVTCRNLEVTVPGRDFPEDSIVVGAHYDSAMGTTGADDNASGVAALLALIAEVKPQVSRHTLRLVAFANEEPPYFHTADMGSERYADSLRREGVRVVAMLSLETLGYYSDRADSQTYPDLLGWVFPNQGNFVGFVGNGDSIDQVRRSVDSFRHHVQFPALGTALGGTDLSDTWAFARRGVPSVMVTDTAMHRTPHYHRPTDTVNTLDFERLSRVVEGLVGVLQDL